MTIFTNVTTLNSTKSGFSTTFPSSLIDGNIIPHQWYQKFTNNRGAPDLALMSVLSEIVYWYRPKRVKDANTGVMTYVNKFLGDAWQSSYEHFEKKLGFNREKLRRIFVKLEQIGICTREFRNVNLRGQTYNNRLFIHLSSEFLKSCTAHKEKPEESSNTNFFAPEEEGGSPHFEGDHIIDKENKNIIKDRSIKSNFCKISFEEKMVEQITNQLVSNEIPEGRALNTNQVKVVFAKGKKLKDFYPLTKEDCQSLQSSSKREFSLNAMNEILADMSKRLTNRVFNSKKAFLSYMSKVFTYEMRDAVKTGNENFKLNNNKACQETTLEEQEKYLTAIEYNLQVSPEWHLKKKLACVFDTEKSYALLQAYRRIAQEGSAFTLHLDKYVELTALDKEIILKQVKATHETIDFAQDEITMIEKLEIKMPEKPVFGAKESRGQNNKNRVSSTTIPDTIWGRVRKSLIAIYGEAIDRHWFSRLEAKIDEESKIIQLKASGSFIQDWVRDNYQDMIKNTCAKENYKLTEITI